MKILKFKNTLIKKKFIHQIHRVELYVKTISEKFKVFSIKIATDARAFKNRKKLKILHVNQRDSGFIQCYDTKFRFSVSV